MLRNICSFTVFFTLTALLIWLQMISNALSFIQGTYHGIWKRKHINLYLAEFCFCFNCRHFHEMLYQRLMIGTLAAPVCRYSKFANPLADSKWSPERYSFSFSEYHLVAHSISVYWALLRRLNNPFSDIQWHSLYIFCI